MTRILRPRLRILLPRCAVVLAGLAIAASTCADPGKTSAAAQSAPPGTKEVRLCDNQTTIRIAQNTPATRENGERIAQALMTKWAGKNPGAARDWVAEENEMHEVPPPDDNRKLIGSGQNSTYGRVTAKDVEIWNRETYKLAVRGSQIFHSGAELGSEIAVSCDMCHPRAANTHPETYPKFQEQLGKVALLRDMINWCIVHPVRGKRLADDDPKMKALEAYILAQRKGVPLDYGRH
jgi:thiosulfate dehydrogenase